MTRRNRTPQIIKPFLASMSYLSQEAARLELRDVEEICSKAEKKLSDYVIAQIFDPEDGDRKISENDRECVKEIVDMLSRMSPQKIKSVVKELEEKGLL